MSALCTRARARARTRARRGGSSLAKIIGRVNDTLILVTVPSDIEMLELRYNATHILANWTEPDLPNGFLRYKINITCTPLLEVETSIFIVQNIVTMETFIVVVFSVDFYSRYEISVTPCTGAGPGNASIESFDTNEGGKNFAGIANAARIPVEPSYKGYIGIMSVLLKEIMCAFND